MLQTGLYPFWFWNGTMEEHELTRQIMLFHKSGCRGVVVHCREGSRISYLSERWMELIRHTVVEAKKLGLKIWIYDESGFPSGNVEGRIQLLRRDLWLKYLHFEYSPTDPDHLADYAFDACSLKRIEEKNLPAGTPALRFFLRENQRHVDVFHPDCGKLFVKMTHERYFEEIGEFFGDSVEAFYTDDQSYLMCGFSGIPWSLTLEEEYRKRFGGELSDYLPLLIEDIPGFSEFRMCFRSLLNDLFIHNFILPQRCWCSKHGLLYTGHLCGDEGPLKLQINRFGSPFFFMMQEDIPGIDDYLLDLNSQRYLQERTAGKNDRYMKFTDSFISPLMTYKYASSVSNQFKKGFLSCECLTFLGWDRTAEFCRTQMLFEIGMGVNLFTPHAWYYTVGGKARTDCPPSYFFQQPGFAHYCELTKCWTRLAELLKHGKFYADTLIVIPDSILSHQHGNDIIKGFQQRLPLQNAAIQQVEDELSVATFTLMRKQIGFDYGAEFLLMDNGKVNNGKLQLGDAQYSHILLPELCELKGKTKELLQQFQKSGGCILSARKFDSLKPDLKIDGTGCEEILVHTRQVGSEFIYYMVNLSGADFNLTFQMPGKFVLYDPETERGIPCDRQFPDGAKLPQGTSCVLLPNSMEYAAMELSESVFAPLKLKQKALLQSIRPLHPNLLPVNADMEFSAGTILYSESEVLQCNGERLSCNAGNSHPADSCFHQFTLPCQTTSIVTDDQQVWYESPVRQKLHPGDLAAQGYPFYWGQMEYRYCFEGHFDFVGISMIHGSASVELNGIAIGIIYSNRDRIFIRKYCSAEANELKIHFANTPQNFLEQNSQTFGIERVTLWSV